MPPEPPIPPPQRSSAPQFPPHTPANFLCYGDYTEWHPFPENRRGSREEQGPGRSTFWAELGGVPWGSCLGPQPECGRPSCLHSPEDRQKPGETGRTSWVRTRGFGGRSVRAPAPGHVLNEQGLLTPVHDCAFLFCFCFSFFQSKENTSTARVSAYLFFEKKTPQQTFSSSLDGAHQEEFLFFSNPLWVILFLSLSSPLFF